MDLGLAGAVAVVTGASKGIGLAVTRALVQEGVRVIAGSRGTSDELRALVRDGAVEHVTVDLATAAGAAALVEAALRHGRLDVLVNNVGAVTPRLAGFLAVTDDQWLASLTANLMAAVRVTRAALPAMIAAGDGVVLTISSVNAVLPDPSVIDYGAAKAALTNAFKALSKEVSPLGIRVNTVSPGPVATDLWLGDGGVAAAVAHATGDEPEAIAARAAAESPTGRFTRPDEVADLVLFLASRRAQNITGADVTIDGGLITTT
ncbi:SDR family oxidoreductase [Actinotalea sp. M2MS4P-6]|uniref:SDR family oxidoreductase n=1 Tax=Actinotalea sp. M2MS4P-6 TaxID=2983762 RepID=UPI0021E4BECD|nr:SDR family oxidoreductase [Actinotalea sp. M2MS4P-6]MCV2393772.1 SDR family oxidoreductase [Actinotalea sp. M2MS4P-6]